MAGAHATSISQNSLLYAFTLLYLLSMMVVAVIAYRKKQALLSKSGHLEAHFGGSFSAPVLLLTTFSTVYSGFTVTGIPSEAFHKGFISLRWVGATLVIVAAMLLFYPRLRRLAVERHYSSPNDFITDRYRSARLRLLCAVCSVVPLLIYITAQTVAFAAMVSGLTLQAIPKWVSMAAFAAFTLILEKLGGMSSVVLTDAVQSMVMIAAFLLVPWVLGLDFGFLGQIAPLGCDTLSYVQGNASDPDVPPETCASAGPGCVPTGCLAEVHPEFYQYPGHADRSNILFFFMNMLAASLQPHMVQRAYIAQSDQSLKMVMAAMLVAPFLAQPPGIVIGLTKAAFDRSWPKALQESTAFSAVSEQLISEGPLEYFLVTTMTCSTLAAIMSTADSALMGASSVVSMDIFKKSLVPSASDERVVRVGELNSVAMMTGAVLLGLVLSVAQFGSLIVFQNGMLMQLLPTFALGLYFPVSEVAVTAGIVVGLAVLVVLAPLGNPLHPYVPLVNVPFIVNCLVVGLAQATVALTGSPAVDEGTKLHQLGVNFREQSRLTLADIKAVMASSREPSRLLVALALLLLLLSVPWYKAPGSPEQIIWGLPAWGLLQCVAFLVVFALGLLATALWVPRGLQSGDEGEESGDSDEAEESNSSDAAESSSDCGSEA